MILKTTIPVTNVIGTKGNKSIYWIAYTSQDQLQSTNQLDHRGTEPKYRLQNWGQAFAN